MNRSQIKHLRERARIHHISLRRALAFSYPQEGSLDTPEIAAARALVKAHDDAIDAAHNNLMDQIDSFPRYIEERLLFVSSESALEALQRFESTTVETLPSVQDIIRQLLSKP
jgi:hypothetical protein